MLMLVLMLMLMLIQGLLMPFAKTSSAAFFNEVKPLVTNMAGRLAEDPGHMIFPLQCALFPLRCSGCSTALLLRRRIFLLPQTIIMLPQSESMLVVSQPQLLLLPLTITTISTTHPTAFNPLVVPGALIPSQVGVPSSSRLPRGSLSTGTHGTGSRALVQFMPSSFTGLSDAGR